MGDTVTGVDRAIASYMFGADKVELTEVGKVIYDFGRFVDVTSATP